VVNVEPWRSTLLTCGIVAAVLYTAMTLFVGMLWDGYSAASQTISELSAIDAPTRPLWVALGTFYTVLIFAFGWIVWKSAPPNRALRVVGMLLMLHGVFGAFWPPMHQRAVLAATGGTLTDSLHIVWASVTGLLFVLETGFGAAALGGRFRRYSIATMAIGLACGAITGTYTAQIQANLATPWAGVWERVSAIVYMLWLAMLAAALLRRRSRSSAFRSAGGEARFMAAYDAALRLWPVPCEELDIATRFGTTHVIASGPKDAPPLVLLHGYMATSIMWSPNIGDFSQSYRVYAIDTMGQPGKSCPGEPIRDVEDYVAWLTTTLDALRLDRISLVGMSFGGWLALAFTVAAPARIRQLVLLSPGGFLPIARQFSLRGMLMVFVPTRFTVRSFMRWAGFHDASGETDVGRVLDVMYLGMKHFRMPPETLRVVANPLSDDELRVVRMPVLLLMGNREVLCDAAAALARARRLMPNVEGELIAGCSHDMCFSHHEIVDARVVDFLKKHGADRVGAGHAA
jgi:pimeloyl-ACP methyl ester carboxylesterase